MKYTTYKATWFIAALVSGCGSQPTNRYAECMLSGDSCNSYVPKADVSVVLSVDKTQPVKKTGVDLPERAQAAYIDALSKKSKTADDLRKNLLASLRNESSGSGLQDETSFDATFIATVSKSGSFNPADKLVRTEVEIKLNNAEIQSWKTVQTAYTTINAGEIESSLKKGGELGLESPSSPSMPVGITAKASIESNLTEKLTISERIEDVTPIINPVDHSITIIRYGGFGLDLTGNALLQTTISSIQSAFQNTFSITTKDSKGAWLPPNKLDLQTQRTKLPRGKDISADVTLRYVLRHVKKGDESPEYGDDIVEMKTESLPPKHFILIPKKGMTHLTYGLFNGENSIFVQIPEKTEAEPLCFDDYASAERFLHYLNRPHRTHLETVGEAKIGFVSVDARGQPTPVSLLDLASVKMLEVQPNCYPSF